MTEDARKYADSLTGLPGRSRFDVALPDMLHCARDQEVPLTLAVVDVDHQGAINEAQGREGGDAVLRALAVSLEQDFLMAGKLYRFGGDAFAVLLPGTSKEAAFLKLETWREKLEQAPLEVEQSAAAPVQLSVTVSVGLAACPDDAMKAPELTQKANEALYRAKVSGRNQICLAREEKMVTKTSHYQQGQLLGLRRLAERKGIGEAVLLREALNDLLRKHNA